MRKTTILIALTITLSSACSHKKTVTEKFCNCFTEQTKLSFKERTEHCNPSEKGQNMDVELVLNALDSCSSYFKEVTDLQLIEVRNRANQNLAQLNQLDTLSKQQELNVKMNRAILASDFELLISLSKKLTELYPQNTDYFFLKAFGHEQLNQLEEALEEYKHLNTLTRSDRYTLSIKIIERRKRNNTPLFIMGIGYANSDEINLYPNNLSAYILATPDEENYLHVYAYKNGLLNASKSKQGIYPSLNTTDSLLITIP